MTIYKLNGYWYCQPKNYHSFMGRTPVEALMNALAVIYDIN